MKKFCLTLALVIGLGSASWAIIQILYYLGPSNSATKFTTLVGAAVPNGRNVLTNLDVAGNANMTVRVLDQGTTVYQINVPSGTVMAKNWTIDTGIVGSTGSDMYITVSTFNAVLTPPRFWDVNFLGYAH